MNHLLPGLSRRNLGRELLAGVTLIAIAIPLNIGYAQIAGLPPTAGLYALVLPTIVWVLLTTSRQLVASPDASAATLVAASIGGLVVAASQNYSTMALAQAIICGVMFIAMAVFKLGFLANFLSRPILIGFIAGLALTCSSHRSRRCSACTSIQELSSPTRSWRSSVASAARIRGQC